MEVLMPTEESNDKEHLWNGDSGASSYKTHPEEGLNDIEASNQVIVVGNGEKLRAVKTEKLMVKTKDMDVNDVIFIINDVKLVTGHWKNLFTIGKLLKEGATLESLGKNMVIIKGKLKPAFREMTESGLMGIKLTLLKNEALATSEKREDLNNSHCKLVHPRKEIVGY
jgi:hypothetical protein